MLQLIHGDRHDDLLVHAAASFSYVTTSRAECDADPSAWPVIRPPAPVTDGNHITHPVLRRTDIERWRLYGP
ncbi:hypothetical protein Q1M64_21030 [Sinorhizobium meliloti]|nr:hypothetical protein Q1M64_21030 [Sinorhizobium meliloti]